MADTSMDASHSDTDIREFCNILVFSNFADFRWSVDSTVDFIHFPFFNFLESQIFGVVAACIVDYGFVARIAQTPTCDCRRRHTVYQTVDFVSG